MVARTKKASSKKPGRKKAARQKPEETLPEVVEAEVVQLPTQPKDNTEYSLGQHQAGVFALGEMSDEEFENRLELMERAEARIKMIFERALSKGTSEEADLMTMAGVKKPFLTQNGSNRVKTILSLVAVPGECIVEGDGKENPIRVREIVWIHIGDKTGPCVGGAWGIASSWEPKFRYRRAQIACPNCGENQVIKGKEEYGGGWLCWKKKGGCGSKWNDGDPAIEQQERGQVEHEDPEELVETLQRFAEKRADVAATRRFSGISRWTNIDEDAPGFRDKAKPQKESIQPVGAPTQEAPPTHIGPFPVNEPNGEQAALDINNAEADVRPSPQDEMDAARAFYGEEPPQGPPQGPKAQQATRWIPPQYVIEYIDELLAMPIFHRSKAKKEWRRQRVATLYSSEGQNPTMWCKILGEIRLEVKKETGDSPKVPDPVAQWGLSLVQDGK